MYGLNLQKRIVIELEVAGPHLFLGSKAPTIQMYQSSDDSAELGKRHSADVHSFGLKWQVRVLSTSPLRGRG